MNMGWHVASVAVKTARVLIESMAMAPEPIYKRAKRTTKSHPGISHYLHNE